MSRTRKLKTSKPNKRKPKKEKSRAWLFIVITIITIIIVNIVLVVTLRNRVKTYAQPIEKQAMIQERKDYTVEQVQLTEKKPPVVLPETKTEAKIVNTDIVAANNTTNNASLNADNLKAQRCSYNGQTYTPGDIVKTEQGWIRCTPTIVFAPNKPTMPVYGNPAWTLVQ